MYSYDLFSDSVCYGASQYGLHPDDVSVKRLFDYTSEVFDWSSRMNLVSSRDLERFIDYHILDSLKVASVTDISSFKRLLDFGSGAGLPGIPVASVYPNIAMTLLDSRLKQTTFLSHVCSSVPFPNCRVVRSRIEDLPRSYMGSFDCILSRATVSLSSFVSLAGSLLSRGGCLISIKGDTIDDELKELHSKADKKVFHISSTSPTPVENVRTGHIVIITRK